MRLFYKHFTCGISLRLHLLRAPPNFPQLFWILSLHMALKYYLYQLMYFQLRYFSYGRGQRHWMTWSGRCYILEKGQQFKATLV